MHGMTDAELDVVRQSLAGIAAARRALDLAEADVIDQARAAGATWQQLAAVLGYPRRSSAFERRKTLAAKTG